MRSPSSGSDWLGAASARAGTPTAKVAARQPVTVIVRRIRLSFGSAGGVAAVDRQGDADDETRAGAAQPQDGRGDLVAAPETADRLARDGVVDRELAACDHVGDQRRLDRSRA